MGEDHVPIIEQRERHHTVAPVRRRIDVGLDLLSRLVLRTSTSERLVLNLLITDLIINK
jgi:hypothetical protein